ncbi:MAG: T9SS C-terminal target domain-containing protein, partial [Bacteroidetes bacterium]
SCFGGSDGAVSVTATGGTAPYTVSGSTSGLSAGTYSFLVTDANGCTSTCTVTIDEPSKVEGTTSTTPANCGSTDGTATVNPTGGTPGYTYLWSDGQTTQTATNLAVGSYSVTITDANGCTGTASATIIGVGGQPDPAGPISGPAGACRNQTGVVYTVAPVSGATSYTWTLPAGASGSSTSNSITVSFSNSYAGGFICVTPENVCGSGTQSCFNVPVLTVRPAQPGFIVGDLNPCGPGVYSYSIPPSANALTYTWSVTGAGVVILSGQGTNAVQVSIPAGFGQGVIAVNASNCIGTTSTRSTVLTGIPTHSNNLNGPGTVCANTSGVAYSIAPVIGAGSTYVWSTTGDMTVVSGNGTTACVVDFGPAFTTGTLNITTSSACGSFTKSYTIRSVPFQPGAIFGPGTNLCNQTGVTYSINPVSTATGYSWTVPAGVNITNNTGLSITVDFTPAFTGTGNICVKAQNACGDSPERCYSVTARPAVPSTPSGPSSVCKSQSGVVYTVPAVPGATSYIWSISGGATISPAGTSATVDFNSATSSTAIITMNAVNACGFSSPAKKTIAVNLGCREASNGLASEVALGAYPNPTTGMITVSFESSSDAKYALKVVDLLGNVVVSNVISASEGTNTQEVDLSNVAKGMYLLSIETDGAKTQTLRVIVE